MGLLTKNETKPTPSNVYNWRVYALACIASFGSLTIGYDSAFIGTTLALPSFTKEFKFAKLTTAELNTTKANIVSLYQAGAFFGALLAYVAGFYLGRKWGLVFFSAIFTLGAGIMLDATGEKGLGAIYAGRVIAGLGIGGISNLVPIYIAEVTPPAIRGRLVGIYELGWQFGGLVGFWINYGLSLHHKSDHSQWLIPFALQLVPGGLLCAGCFWIRESPRWLYSRGKREQALKNLCWIRQLPADDLYVVEEVADIDAALEAQAAGYGVGIWSAFKALRESRIVYRFFLGSMLFVWQNASGINAVNYYSPTVFKSLGITGTNTGFLTTGLFGVVKTVMAFIWLLFLIDRYGRRNILLVGGLGGSVTMFIIAGLVKNIPVSTSTVAHGPSSIGVAGIFFFYLWTVFYGSTWNGTPWVYNSEMFDLNTRSLGQASAAASNWLYNFLISRFTPQMFTSMHYGVYLFFGALSFCSIIFVWFLLPETKGIPLEYTDRLFNVHPVWKANAVVKAELVAEELDFRRRVSEVGLDKEGAVYSEKMPHHAARSDDSSS